MPSSSLHTATKRANVSHLVGWHRVPGVPGEFKIEDGGPYCFTFAHRAEGSECDVDAGTLTRLELAELNKVFGTDVGPHLASNPTFTKHEDSAHGWLEVLYSDLVKLGIADKISPYSYQSQDGATIYLEEDCDQTLFMAAMIEAGSPVRGSEINVVYHRGDCFVRHCPSFPSVGWAASGAAGMEAVRRASKVVQDWAAREERAARGAA